MLSYFVPDLESEFATRERCHIVELLNTPEFAELSVARCRVAPGITTELHSLKDTDEVYVVLNGSGLMADGSHPGRLIKAMDCVHIPANHPQKVTNTGSTDLIFLAICSGRFKPDCYVPHEQPEVAEPADGAT
ncbi:hypothetical protein AB833_28710 [Chromatiales bacterium (ex Bugula neritina AB1)]|nr:hypothetical protein AB833_28710 [Chromatiales bacterium (ex Bugula neritina AB1)]